ncbi:hypothetical protein BN978_05206 [Mycolicibacterium mageritense DSM 44476 = CIP 104973]|nr:hypothetical protein BN978_05206 [Mycolicibacterium mageritense DSM 44476 = CIP 104973]
MKLTRIFAKATIAAGLGIAALGAASGVAHSAPPSPDLSATVWAQGGWGWGHHGWGPPLVLGRSSATSSAMGVPRIRRLGRRLGLLTQHQPQPHS